jgi:hypothetical protein
MRACQEAGLESRHGCAASRLRSGSPTRLRFAAKRRNQPQILHRPTAAAPCQI